MNDSYTYFEKYDVTMEMGTICVPKTYPGGAKCRVYIVIHTHDHGNSLGDGKIYLPDSKSPAHAHIQLKGKTIGCLNITGSCPMTKKEVVEYKKAKESEMKDYYDDIVVFATHKTENGNTGWEELRRVWEENQREQKGPKKVVTEDFLTMENIYEKVTLENAPHVVPKIFKCPFCEARFVKKDAMYVHVEKTHSDEIPENVTVKQHCFNVRNNKTFSLCVQCRKNKTAWNEDAERYSRYCSEKCLKEYVTLAKERMVQKYGKTHILDDPNHQIKMQDARSISGMYTFSSDGIQVPYMGQYELHFLQHLDIVYGWNGAMVSRSPHFFPYTLDGTERIYIPDYFIPDFNLIVEIKDTTSTHPHYIEHDKPMEIQKDGVMRVQTGVNYVKCVNKKYNLFATMIHTLRLLAWDTDDFRRIGGVILIPDD